MTTLRDRYRGCLLGGAVGDALGAEALDLMVCELIRGRDLRAAAATAITRLQQAADVPLAARQPAVVPRARPPAPYPRLPILGWLAGDNAGPALTDHDRALVRELAEGPLQGRAANALPCLEVADGRKVRPGRK